VYVFTPISVIYYTRDVKFYEWFFTAARPVEQIEKYYFEKQTHPPNRVVIASIFLI